MGKKKTRIYPKTMTDQELEGLEVTGGPSHKAKAKAFGGGSATPPPAAEDVVANSIAWKLISAKHPDYDEEYWEECRALYAGGKKLLRNKELMARVFPAHNAEDKKIYQERVKRAHYFPYPGAIIDSIASGLGADPVTVLPSDPDDKEAKLGSWWTTFFEDVTKPGAERCSLSHMAVSQVKEAMVTGGVSWMLVDLPMAIAPDDPSAPKDRLEQEKMGLLHPYITAIPAENVIEWQGTDGELDWITICDTEARRDSILVPRGTVVKTFTIWTKTEWIRYAITIDPNKLPNPDDLVERIGSGTHPFKRVPVVRIELSEGLRAMDKLESMAREHLNKRNALSWAEYKSLFALLYEFLAAEEGTSTTPVGMAQENPDRAIDGTKGQGYVNERGAKDSAAYIGPDTAPFSEARESCDQIKREMYRVTHSMADSVDQGAASARQSGESKGHDHRSKSVLLKELGRYAREAVHAIMTILQEVKGQESHRIGGGDSFDSVDLAAKVNEAVELLNGIPMKSPTFLRIYLERLYSLVLKGELTEKEKEAIRNELAMMTSMEEMMMMDSVSQAPPLRPSGEEGKEDLDDDGDMPRSVPLRGEMNYKG